VYNLPSRGSQYPWLYGLRVIVQPSSLYSRRKKAELTVQKVEQVVRLLLFVANNVPGKPLVDIQCLLPSHGMYTDQRVLFMRQPQWITPFSAHGAHLRLHWLSADRAALSTRILSLSHSTVYSREPFEALLECRGESLVGFDLAGEPGVSARLGLFEDPEEGRSRWLLFVRDIAVPLGLADAA